MILSDIVALFGSAAGAYLLDRYNFNRYLSSGAGGIIGNYVSAAVSYLLFAPISLGLAYERFKPDEAAFYASILSAVIFMAGSNIINQRIIKSHNI